MAWTVEFLNETVEKELEVLPAGLRARFIRISDLISEHGIRAAKMPDVKHLQGKLWEMRLKGKDQIARALYVTVFEERVVVVRIFVKKTQKTPPREIKLALERAKEIEK